MGRANDRITTAMVNELFRRLDIQDGVIVNLINKFDRLTEVVGDLAKVIENLGEIEKRTLGLVQYGIRPCDDAISVPKMPPFLQPGDTFTEPIVTFTEPVVTFTEPKVESR